MTELAAGRVYTATLHGLVYYTNGTGNFSALLIRGYPQLTRPPFPCNKSGMLSPYTQNGVCLGEHFSVYPKWCLLLVNKCRSVFASSTPTNKVTFDRCQSLFESGSIAVIFQAVGSHNEDNKIPRIG